MASARGDALDWALALARVPGERHALRQRPLPGGMDTVLQIAVGTHAAAVTDAAAYSGMAPADVVEAARFYLREMLFFPDADVYRVLGLAADASDEQIKYHHRLLQQWLHPDRPTSDWDAAFAARVNAAWSQVRTPARREAYANRVGATGTATAGEPSWTQPARIPAVAMAEEALDAGVDDDRWRRRAPVLALFAVCAVLGVLAVRDMQREPGASLDVAGVAAKTLDEESQVVGLQLPPVGAAPGAAERRTSAGRHPQSRVVPSSPDRVADASATRSRPIPVVPAQPAAKKPVTPSVVRPAAVAVASNQTLKPRPKPIVTAARPASKAPTTVTVAGKPKVEPPKRVVTNVARVPSRNAPVSVSAAAPVRKSQSTAAVAVPIPVKPPPKAVVAAARIPVKAPVKEATAPLRARREPIAKAVPVAAPVPAKPPARSVARPIPEPVKPAPKALVAGAPVRVSPSEKAATASLPVPVPSKPTAKAMAAVAPAPVRPSVRSDPGPAVAPVKPAAKVLVAREPAQTKPPVGVAAPPKLAPKTQVAVAAVPAKPSVKPAAKVDAGAPVVPLAAAVKPVNRPPTKPLPIAPPPADPKPSVAVAPAAVAVAPVAMSPPATAPVANSPAQMAQAQQTGQRLIAFVTGRGSGTPPIWANLGAQRQASLAREALRGNGRIAVGTPDWRLGGASAGMQASLTPGDGRARRLRVDMVWREQRWLVTGLALEQAP